MSSGWFGPNEDNLEFDRSRIAPLERAKAMMPPKVPDAAYRHAAPSAPWPWMDDDSEVDPDRLDKKCVPQQLCVHDDSCNRCWLDYPQSLFGNWTQDQVERSRIQEAIYRNVPGSTIYSVDMMNDGSLANPMAKPVKTDEETDEFWDTLVKQGVPEGLRVRCHFLDNMSGPVLQILGTRYNIEPFFFSSSLNWIPTQYQSNTEAGASDHLTITVAFLRIMQDPMIMTRPGSRASGSDRLSWSFTLGAALQEEVAQDIDTQSPLPVRSSDKIVLLDLLAIHMIRDKKRGSTIISYHPTREWRATSAKRLWSRVRLANQSAYWQKIFEKTTDSTFLLLLIVWHALCAWNEALETLQAHVCWLETQASKDSDVFVQQDVYLIRAHLLHWEPLLGDLIEVIRFLRNTPNPSIENQELTPDDERERTNSLMERECNSLESQIHRLKQRRNMIDRRLENVSNLVSSTMNIDDSRQMTKLTQAAVLDSAAMKQVAYLTMIFLPATFVAGVFGMNVSEINPGSLGTLPHYLEAALSLTLLTIYLIIMLQYKIYMGKQNVSVWQRLWWPITFIRRALGRGKIRGHKTTTHFNDLRTSTTTDAREVKRAWRAERQRVLDMV